MDVDLVNKLQSRPVSSRSLQVKKYILAKNRPMLKLKARHKNINFQKVVCRHRLVVWQALQQMKTFTASSLL